MRWAVVVGICVGALLLIALLMGLVDPLPRWFGLPLVFLVSVVSLSGLGSLAHSMGAPRGWLVLAAGALLLALGPLLLLWVHGSWDAEFSLPRRRGGVVLLEVAAFSWLAAAVGGALSAVGLLGYALGRRRVARDFAATRRATRREPHPGR